MANKKYKYLEIINRETKDVSRRMDVSLHNWSRVEKIEDGVEINLDHDKYYVYTFSSEEKLESI